MGNPKLSVLVYATILSLIPSKIYNHFLCFPHITLCMCVCVCVCEGACVYKFGFVVHKEYNFDYIIIHHTFLGVQVFCTATHLLSFFLSKGSLLYFISSNLIHI